MEGRIYTVAQAATVAGCSPRTVRRHLAADRLPGAYQQRTASGAAWRIPAAALDKLRAHLALDVAPCTIEADAPQLEADDNHQPQGFQLAAGPFDAGQLGAALVELAKQQAVAIGAQAQQVEAARDDALWWRCEALDARQQLDQVRAQLAAAQAEAAQLRARIEHHQRATVPIPRLRVAP